MLPCGCIPSEKRNFLQALQVQHKDEKISGFNIGSVYQLMKIETPVMAPTTIAPLPSTNIDFFKIINEIIGTTTDANPYYSTSDAYFSVSNVVLTSEIIEIVKTQRTGFQLTNRVSNINLVKVIACLVSLNFNFGSCFNDISPETCTRTFPSIIYIL